MQDLVHGIKKIITVDAPKEVAHVEPSEVVATVNIAPLLDRAFLFLEDGEFDRADEFCEQVLNQDPRNAKAYLAKLMIDFDVRKQENLVLRGTKIEENSNYQKAIRFGDAEFVETLKNYALQAKYNQAQTAMRTARTESEFKQAAQFFALVPDYKDAASLQKQCLERAENARKEAIYNDGAKLLKNREYIEAATIFESIPGHKDADELAVKCRHKADELKKVAVYKKAEEAAALDNSSDMKKAAELFSSISGWRDAAERAVECSNKVEELKRKEKINEKRSIITGISLLAVFIIAMVNLALYRSLVVNIKKDGVRYKKVEEEFHVVGWTGDATELEIQAEIKGKPVTTIEKNAFANNKALTDIVVPNAIKKIGFGAFNGCTSLSSITLPFVGKSDTDTENTHLGYIFGADIGEKNGEFVPETLKTVEISSGTNIAEAAFKGCSHIENITISKSVISIDDRAFDACLALESIVVDSENAYYFSQDGILYKTWEKNFLYVPLNLKGNIVIPEGVTKIPEALFANHSKITSVTIPSTVSSIGAFAFGSCKGLVSITIPSSVTRIDVSAFLDCTNMTGATFESPNGWKVSSVAFEENIASNLLKNVQVAANYLKFDYCQYKWTRS